MVKSSVKSAESYPNTSGVENYLGTNGVAYRLGVYKNTMVRMVEKPDEFSNVRV